jgi:rare lipoprotein A
MKLIPIIILSLFMTLSGFRAGDDQERKTQTGLAAYYNDSHQGKRTANGETYQKDAYTAAHRTLPFGTKVKVTNLANGRSVTVRINDRGPYSRNRIIDLSRIAAQEIGLIQRGIARVSIEYEK